MAENSVSNVMESLIKGMDSVISTKTVVGEPTVIGDTIIVPLIDVNFGCLGGANLNATDKKNGSAGGFWGKESPSAVLVIKNGQTKLVNVKNQDAITKLIDLVPDLIDRFTTPKEQMVADDVAEDLAFGQKEE